MHSDFIENSISKRATRFSAVKIEDRYGNPLDFNEINVCIDRNR